MNAFNVDVLGIPEVRNRLEQSLRNLPNVSDPSIIMSLVKGLYELNKGKIRVTDIAKHFRAHFRNP